MSYARMPSLFLSLLLIIAGDAAAQQTQSPPREGQRVTMGRDLAFSIVPPWRLVGDRRTWVNELTITTSGGLLVARAVVTREDQRSTERSRQRLLVTAGPATRGGELFLFRGWPAFRSSTTENLLNRRGQVTENAYRHHVLAIAAGATFITVDISDYGSADGAVSALLDSVTIPTARDVKAGEREIATLRDLRNKPWDTVNPIQLPAVRRGDYPILIDRGFKPAVRVVGGTGEVEITASPNGRNIVVGTNSGYANSTDYGATFTLGAGATPFPVITTRGDPSTGYGVTGAFYMSYLGNPAGGGTGANAFNGCTVPVAASSDNGATWAFRGDARQCANTVSATSNCFADQEHITADARNPGRRRVGRLVRNADQVYAVWREFSATVGSGSPTTCNGISTATTGFARVSRVACSRDGGRTWSVAPVVSTAPTFDYSKITVGRDGRVYIVSALMKSDGWTDLYVDQFSSCMKGFNREAFFPHVVGWYKTPKCTVGLDRCSNLGSPTIAVSPDFGDLVWIGASFPADDNNDRVIVALSSTSGTDFFGWRQISDNVPGRKFMPWICVTGKHLFASWYDRRPSNGVASDNSLTDFYLGRMDFEFPGPKVGANINMSVNADSHCSSGWPSGARDVTAATDCKIGQPQAYGVCTSFVTTPPTTGANCVPGAVPGTCPITQTCASPGLGVPKYGDYNGLACGGGYAFAAWTTATAPIAGAPAGLAVWVRPYQAEVQGPLFTKWGVNALVQQWWKGP
jgi:hypothetical protein